MRHGADSVIIGRESVQQCALYGSDPCFSAQGLADSAKKLSEATGKRCLPTAADVRQPEELKSAVLQAVKQFGKIDYVICGACERAVTSKADRSSGAAGNL